jgi:hypothetical protein
MTWDVTYHRLGEMRVRNTTTTGETEFEARRNFHANNPKCKIKMLWPKDKDAILTARQLHLQKPNSEKKESNGMN